MQQKIKETKEFSFSGILPYFLLLFLFFFFMLKTPTKWENLKIPGAIFFLTSFITSRFFFGPLFKKAPQKNKAIFSEIQKEYKCQKCEQNTIKELVACKERQKNANLCPYRLKENLPTKGTNLNSKFFFLYFLLLFSFSLFLIIASREYFFSNKINQVSLLGIIALACFSQFSCFLLYLLLKQAFIHRFSKTVQLYDPLTTKKIQCHSIANNELDYCFSQTSPCYTFELQLKEKISYSLGLLSLPPSTYSLSEVKELIRIYRFILSGLLAQQFIFFAKHERITYKKEKGIPTNSPKKLSLLLFPTKKLKHFIPHDSFENSILYLFADWHHTPEFLKWPENGVPLTEFIRYTHLNLKYIATDAAEESYVKLEKVFEQKTLLSQLKLNKKSNPNPEQIETYNQTLVLQPPEQEKIQKEHEQIKELSDQFAQKHPEFSQQLDFQLENILTEIFIKGNKN